MIIKMLVSLNLRNAINLVIAFFVNKIINYVSSVVYGEDFSLCGQWTPPCKVKYSQQWAKRYCWICYNDIRKL